VNFELTEFAQTLAIGGFVIVGLWGAVALMVGTFQPSRLARLLPQSIGALLFGSTWLANVFMLVLIAAVGLLAEDVSNKYVDTDDLLEWIEDTLRERAPAMGGCEVREVGTYLPKLLRPRTEKKIRAAALFGEGVGGGKPDELAIAVAQVGGYSTLGGTYGLEVERDLLKLDGIRMAGAMGRVPGDHKQPSAPATLTCPARLEWLATRVYYPAKNEVYREPNYFDELAKIQKRIDFARSITLLAASLFLLLSSIAALKAGAWLLFASGPYLSAHAWRKWPLRLTDAKSWSDSAAALKMRWTLRVFFGGVLCLIAMYAASLFAYHAEETEFDRRTYGYYTSLRASQGKASASSWLGFDGASALLRLPDSTGYIAVADMKGGEADRIDMARIAHLAFAPDGAPHLEPVPTVWSAGSPPPFDLEAACWVVPQKTFLVFESGSQPARDPTQTASAEEVRLPKVILMQLQAGGSGYAAYEIRSWSLANPIGEIEGVICKGTDPVDSLIFAADRSSADGDVRLYRIWLLENGHAKAASDPVRVPEVAKTVQQYNRLVSDLWLTRDGEIIAAAADEPDGRLGLFKSAIYTLGDLDTTGSIKPRVQLRATIDGFKVEAISPTDNTARCMIIGTDDEAAGSAWRRVFLNEGR